MTHCTVLRCSREAETLFRPRPEDEAFALPVCDAHDHAIANGASWLLDGDMGVPVDSGPTAAGVTLRMGADFPPTIQQITLTRTTGHTPGVRISLTHYTHEGPGSTEFWMTVEQARTLGEFFNPPQSGNPDRQRG